MVTQSDRLIDLRFLDKVWYVCMFFLALRYFERVDQLGITDEPCIHGKKQAKIF
jgi:hypothetical protein